MQGRQVLLLLDNCTGHIPLEKFAEMNLVPRNTHVFYLLPNMTLAVQPCDAGIIRTFKAYYRKRFNNLLLDGYENNIDNPEKISILDAFRLAVPTWVEDVSLATIANCFRHCKTGPATSSTHNKGKLVLPPPLSRSCSIKWFSFHTGIPWTSAIFSTIRRRTTTWWHQMMRTSPIASLRSSAHSRMKTRQATTTTVWNRQKSTPVKLRSI